MPQNSPPPPMQQNNRPQPVRPAPRTRPPADPTLQQRAWAAVMLSLIGLFGLPEFGSDVERGVYVIGVAVVIAATGVWLAITAMKRARRIGSSRPRGAIFAVVFGSIAVVTSALMLMVLAAFWPQWTQLSRCGSQAMTNTAQQACWQQFQDSAHVILPPLPTR